MNKLNSIGIIGLGVMGKALTENLLEKKISVSVYNRSTNKEKHVISNFISTNKHITDLKGFTKLLPFIKSLKQPRKIILMLPAGKIIDTILKSLNDLLITNDIIIDCGNSNYKDAKKRSDFLSKNKIEFIDCGISGGQEGAKKGPSIMIGGKKTNYIKIKSFLQTISAKDNNNLSCCAHMGGLGSGHYVKMIHNGIEYGEMQLIAETFSLLKIHHNYNQIANIFEEWNKTEHSSFLLKATINILREKNNENTHILDTILDEAKSKGTGVWASKEGLNIASSNSIMISSVMARNLSLNKTLREKMNLKRNKTDNSINLNSLKEAFIMARIINHHQGFQLLLKASSLYNWKMEISEIARIWTNGSIIKSNLMIELIRLMKKNSNILKINSVFKDLIKKEKSIKKLILFATQNSIPVNCYSSAYNFWISITSKSLNANLIQAQRDYFGNHGYIDIEKNSFKNYNWH
tara:strand:+ start:3246 stop:4634 length:1389 start_codon:yes stop_codon:yes gene_type:complete